VKRAIRRARLAGCAPTIEETIWRAATYTQEDVEAVTAKLPQSLRVPLSKLLQRSPAARHQTAGELETELRRWLAGSFDKGDAVAELKDLRKAAGEVMVEMGLKRPHRDGRSPDDITTR
jgi:isopentenyl diphosphate isomerase/L-lactate dehydrogenase-like FMN-dependent dehydrogenase